jgi:hypothetical protein
MKTRRPIKVKVYLRAVTAISLLVVWALVTFTGILIWAAPSGQRSGQRPLLFDLTKSEWGDIHFWVAAATVAVTLVHIIIDWKALRGVIRYLASVHREQGIRE